MGSIYLARARQLRDAAEEARVKAKISEENLARCVTSGNITPADAAMVCFHWANIIQNYETLQAQWEEAALTHIALEAARSQVRTRG